MKPLHQTLIEELQGEFEENFAHEINNGTANSKDIGNFISHSVTKTLERVVERIENHFPSHLCSDMPKKDGFWIQRNALLSDIKQSLTTNKECDVRNGARGVSTCEAGTDGCVEYEHLPATPTNKEEELCPACDKDCEVHKWLTEKEEETTKE